MTSRSFKDKDIKLLWGKAARICSFDGCETELFDENSEGSDVVIGEQAHIVAHSPDGPRGEASYPLEKINNYENLILLCPTHHTKIDKNPEKYSVELLLEMKQKHENWIAKRVINNVSKVGFPELAVLIRGVVGKSTSTEGGSDLVLTPPKEKMNKNSFNAISKQQVTIGLIKAGEVSDYLSKMSGVDGDFGERLKSVLVDKYLELKKEDLDSNEILDRLKMFCSMGKDDVLSQAAGLSVVVYFFQACEIFEK